MVSTIITMLHCPALLSESQEHGSPPALCSIDRDVAVTHSARTYRDSLPGRTGTSSSSCMPPTRLRARTYRDSLYDGAVTEGRNPILATRPISRIYSEHLSMPQSSTGPCGTARRSRSPRQCAQSMCLLRSSCVMKDTELEKL